MRQSILKENTIVKTTIDKTKWQIWKRSFTHYQLDGTWHHCNTAWLLIVHLLFSLMFETHFGHWYSLVSVISHRLFLHVLIELRPTSLVLEAGLCQVNWENTGDSNHACNPSIDQLGWQAVQRQVAKHNYLNAFVEQVGAAADTDLK